MFVMTEVGRRCRTPRTAGRPGTSRGPHRHGGRGGAGCGRVRGRGSRRGGRRALRAATRGSPTASARPGRTRPRTAATRRLPRRSVRYPSRPRRPGRATCLSAPSDRRSRAWSSSAPCSGGAGEPRRRPVAGPRCPASPADLGPHRQARALTNERRHPISTTLSCRSRRPCGRRMADPEAGEALLSGRLTSPMSYSGLGTTMSRPALHLVPPATTPGAAPGDAPTQPRPSRRAGGVRRRSTPPRARGTAAGRRGEARSGTWPPPRQAAEEAPPPPTRRSLHWRSTGGRPGPLAARRTKLQARVDELADQLADAEREVADAADGAEAGRTPAVRRRAGSGGGGRDPGPRRGPRRAPRPPAGRLMGRAPPAAGPHID